MRNIFKKRSMVLLYRESPDYAVSKNTKKSTWHDFPVGVDARNKTVFWNINKSPNLLAGGNFQGRREDVINNIFFHCLSNSDKFSVVGIEHTQRLFAPYKKYDKNIDLKISSRDGAVKEINRVYDEMLRRYENISSSLDTKKHQKQQVKQKTIILMFEEVFFALCDSGLENEEQKEAQREMRQQILDISRRGNKAGIHLIFMTRNPGAGIVTEELKQNFSCRLAVERIDMNHSFSLLGNHEATNLLSVRGHAYFQDHGTGKQIRLFSHSRESFEQFQIEQTE